MNDLIISLVFVSALPILSLVVFKSNAAVQFFAACAGIVLLNGLDPAVVSTSAAVLPGEGESYVRVSVVFLSLLLAAMLFKGAIRKPAGYVLSGLIAVLVSVMLWLILPAATGLSWLVAVTDESIWQTVHDYETLIVALGFSVSLISILRQKSIK